MKNFQLQNIDLEIDKIQSFAWDDECCGNYNMKQ